jgi:hypothetical protein
MTGDGKSRMPVKVELVFFELSILFQVVESSIDTRFEFKNVSDVRVKRVLIVLCYDETSLCIVEGGDVCSGIQEK